MKNVVFDIETNGLLPELTKLHCLVIRDIDTDEVVSCADQPGYTPIKSGLELLAKAAVVYGHNSIGFDIPAIKKVYPSFQLNGAHRDTFVIAGMRFAHLKDQDFKMAKVGKFPAHLAGRHSLEAWGHRLGNFKGEYKKWCTDNGISDPFAEWRPEMQEYCDDDTSVTKSLVLHIRKMGVSAESVETELELREYLVKQEQNGWPFDLDKAIALQGKLAARRQQLEEELVATFGSWEVNDGKPFVPKRDNKKLGYTAGVAVQKKKTVTFNPASRAHIADRLQTLYEWKPEQYTDGGSPQVDESVLKGLPYPPIPLLLEYLLVEKRLGQLAEGKEAWLRHAKLDARTGLHHIYGRVLQNGTITHRSAHANPNIGQVPKVGVQYGAECRALFYVPEGWVQIGADASGLELRCLAHYMARYDGGAYMRTILEGRNEDKTDIHSVNQRALGLPDVMPPGSLFSKGRDVAKTFIYAFLYGAGDELIGALIEPTASSARKKKLGKELKKKFLAGLPALGMLLDAVAATAKKQGYLTTLDGRRVYIRHEHAALNSLLQTAGAIICKRWIVMFNRGLEMAFGPQGWDGKWAALGWIHDEVQLAVRPEIADDVSKLLVSSIESLTEHFKFRCPLTGEAKLGANWKETH